MSQIIAPIEGLNLSKDTTQLFGVNRSTYKSKFGIPGHNGLDFVKRDAPNHGYGEEIVASHDGKVWILRQDVPHQTAGNGVYILSEDSKFATVYWHLSQFLVNVGQKVKQGDVVGLMGNCFDDRTEILTDEGWKLFSDLNKNEKVITLNPKTEEIEYKKPNGYIKKKVPEMVYYENGRRIDFVVSKDHKMIVYTGSRTPSWRKIRKERLYKDLPGTFLLKPGEGKWKGNNKDYFVLPSHKYIGDRWGTTRKHKAIKIKMDTWLAFLGFWCSDGWLVNNKTYSVGITQ